MKNWTPTYLSGAPQQPSEPTPSATNDAITLCGGWYETAFAEWDGGKIGSNVNVSYRTGNGSFTSVDKELIRGNRVDIPGLKGGTAYEVKIEGSTGTAGCTVTPMAYDRSGYAHYNFNSGVGAYNNDGTLKPDPAIPEREIPISIPITTISATTSSTASAHRIIPRSFLKRITLRKRICRWML